MKFPDTDEKLWAYVRARVNARPAVTMSHIARELGLHVDDLCAWIMAYREPRPTKGEQRKKPGPPMLLAGTSGGQVWSQSRQARAFAAWRKQHDGAVRARQE